MVTKAVEKIIDALTQLMEGYSELQESIEADYAGDGDEFEENTELDSEVDAAIITETRAALEAVIDSEDYSTEEIASALSTLNEALEEIDPDVFESEDDEEEDSEEVVYDVDDEEYYDDSDDFEEFEEDEDEDEDEDDEELEDDDEFEDDEFDEDDDELEDDE